MAATTARADALPFSEEFCEGGTNFCAFNNPAPGASAFNGMELFIETPGVTFSDAGAVYNSDPWGQQDPNTNWAAFLVNDQYIQYQATGTGDQTNPLSYMNDFANGLTMPFTMDFYALLDGVVVDSDVYTYNGNGSGAPQSGSGWGEVSLSAETLVSENTTPEPATFALMGAALIGLSISLRRKRASC
jgi:hypothetical protein